MKRRSRPFRRSRSPRNSFCSRPSMSRWRPRRQSSDERINGHAENCERHRLDSGGPNSGDAATDRRADLAGRDQYVTEYRVASNATERPDAVAQRDQDDYDDGPVDRHRHGDDDRAAWLYDRRYDPSDDRRRHAERLQRHLSLHDHRRQHVHLCAWRIAGIGHGARRLHGGGRVRTSPDGDDVLRAGIERLGLRARIGARTRRPISSSPRR